VSGAGAWWDADHEEPSPVHSSPLFPSSPRCWQLSRQRCLDVRCLSRALGDQSEKPLSAGAARPLARLLSGVAVPPCCVAPLPALPLARPWGFRLEFALIAAPSSRSFPDACVVFRFGHPTTPVQLQREHRACLVSPA